MLERIKRLLGRLRRTPLAADVLTARTPDQVSASNRKNFANWLAWWTRNAAEMPLGSKEREDILRWVLAALLTGDLDELQRDLQRVHADAQQPGATRTNAMLLHTELNAPVLPWVMFAHDQRETGREGDPLHNLDRVREAYRSAVFGDWGALFGRSDRAVVPIAVEMPPEIRVLRDTLQS